VVGGAVDGYADLLAEALHGGAGGLDAVLLVQVVGQLLVSPVGAVEALLGGPLDDPVLDLVGQREGDAGLLARGLAPVQAVQALLAEGVEPARHGAAVDAEVQGDVLPRPPAVGHEHDLQAVAQLAVLSLLEQLFETLRLALLQLDANHGPFLPAPCQSPPFILR
jgi:hypothetical protein